MLFEHDHHLAGLYRESLPYPYELLGNPQEAQQARRRITPWGLKNC